jgi:hypothetical protein
VHRNLINLIQIHNIQNGHKDALCLFKLAVSYFQLGKMNQAVEFISACCKIQQIEQYQFWKGIIFFYYVVSMRST